MAKKVHITLACGDYDIVKPLIDGAVEPDGIELTLLTGMGSRDRHWRMARGMEFDACEMNIAAYFIARDQGHPVTALPIFLHRRFRHGFVFVNTGAGIEKPTDLIGKRIAGTNFQPAGNVWIRSILEHDYDVPHRDITWVVERGEDVEFERPPGLRIERAPAGASLDAMLVEGDVAAMISPSFPEPFLRGDPRVARLFPDYKTIEIEYYRRTGIFPIMHVMEIKQEIVARYPWLPFSLKQAFDAAKRIAYRRAANPRMVPLAWVRTAFEEQQEILGPDPWVYGLGAANRRNLETIAGYCHEQGLTRSALSVDELFVDPELEGQPERSGRY